MWKACLGILPTYDLVWHRYMRRDGICFCCKVDVESVLHVICPCPAANDVWLQSGLSLHKWDRSIYSSFLSSCVCSETIEAGRSSTILLYGFLHLGAKEWVDS